MRVSARGNGGFSPYVRKGWYNARHNGIPKSGGPIDYLVCVADADRAQACCGIGAAPESPAETTSWVKEANLRWTEQLRREGCDEEDRIFGRFLRWNKESLLIAGYDVPSAFRVLGCREVAALDAFFTSCHPDPRGLPDDRFVHVYRQPGSCFDALAQAARGPRLSKKDRRIDDALGHIAEQALPRLLGRVPDLSDLAELLCQLGARPDVSDQR